MSQHLTVKEAIESRRSIRKYTDQPVTEAEIREVVRLAGLAPSSMNVQPWRVVAVTDHDTRVKLRAAAYNQAQVEAAPVVFAILTDTKDTMETIKETVHPGYGDKVDAQAETVKGVYAGMPDDAREQAMIRFTYIFLGFFLLAAESLGFATSPMTGFEPQKVKEVLGLPDHVHVSALVAMGHKNEEGFSHHRHAVDRILTLR